MRIDQILDTYDAQYAEEYDRTFLHDAWTKDSVAYQIELLSSLLARARNWLDVACGTGYVLSRFPHVDRAGLDLSPDMLAKARARNPSVPFLQRDYREPYPAWNEKWDVVSCMWWAYCFSETMTDIQRLIGRLADWTSPEGVCFLPLCNPQKFDRHNTRIPYIDVRVPGRCMITGVTWSWIQENGKRHDDMLSPQVDHLIAMFRQHFEQVEISEGPLDVIGEGWRVQDVLIASRKRPQRPSGPLYLPADDDALGRLEWLFSVAPGVLASMSYPTRDLRHVRVTIDRHETDAPADIRTQKIGYRVQESQRYRLSFAAAADAERPFHVGFSYEPGGQLCASQIVTIGTEWTPFTLDFQASMNATNGHLFFDVGGSAVAIDIRDVHLRAVE